MNFTDLVVNAGVEQDALSRGGFARVNMRHDPDVADLGEVCCGSGGGHEVLLLFWWKLESGLCADLPAVVSERLVGFGHLVGVFALLHACPEAVAGIQDFVHEAFRHRLLAAIA